MSDLAKRPSEIRACHDDQRDVRFYAPGEGDSKKSGGEEAEVRRVEDVSSLKF